MATLTIVATGFDTPQYSIDGGVTYHPTGVFSNIPSGLYNIVIKDAQDKTYSTVAATIEAPLQVGTQFLGEILSAIITELQYLFADLGATVLFESNFSEGNVPTYTYPCIILDLNSIESAGQLIGGWEQIEMDLQMIVVNYMTNANNSDDSGAAMSNIDVCDKVRRHFNGSAYFSDAYKAIRQKYSFRTTFSGIGKASTPIEIDGITTSYGIKFECVAYDNTNASVKYSTQTLQQVIVTVA
jgi:hypothetical protein